MKQVKRLQGECRQKKKKDTRLNQSKSREVASAVYCFMKEKLGDLLMYWMWDVGESGEDDTKFSGLSDWEKGVFIY